MVFVDGFNMVHYGGFCFKYGFHRDFLRLLARFPKPRAPSRFWTDKSMDKAQRSPDFVV